MAKNDPILVDGSPVDLPTSKTSEVARLLDVRFFEFSRQPLTRSTLETRHTR